MALLGEHHLTIPGETLPAKRTQRPPSDAAGDDGPQISSLAYKPIKLIKLTIVISCYIRH